MNIKLSLREAYNLANMQGIMPEIEIRINCPYCSGKKKSLVLKLRHKTAYCYNCKKKIARSDFDALATMIQEEALHDRRGSKSMMESQPGFDN